MNVMTHVSSGNNQQFLVTSVSNFFNNTTTVARLQYRSCCAGDTIFLINRTCQITVRTKEFSGHLVGIWVFQERIVKP